MFDSSPLTFSRKATYFLAAWFILVGLQTLVLHRLELEWWLSVTDSVVSNGLLALAALATSMVYRYYQPEKGNRIYLFGFGLTVTFLNCLGVGFAMKNLLPENHSYLEFLDKSMPVRYLFSLLVVVFIALLSWIRNRLTDQKEMEHRKLESEQLMKEAELARLRQQLHPHFLFNSLNSINALIGSQPEAARRMTQQLSDFLRGTIRKEDKLIHLKEELDHLQLYLEIEKVRFGSRLQVVFSTTPDSLEQHLPALLLQPILENAIKFGLYDVLDEVFISLKTQLEAGYLVVEITNPFESDTSSFAGNGTGFGLESIRRRLQLLYARPDLLTTSIKDNVFTTKLRIPIGS